MVKRYALFGLLIAVQIILASCGRGGGPFNFGLYNNLHETVVLKTCSNTKCTSTFNATTFVPGQRAQDVGVPDGAPRAEALFSLSGRELGCLPFQFSTTPPGNLQVYLSELIPCGHSGGVHGHDWPSIKH
jgi:hypothetical protein